MSCNSIIFSKFNSNCGRRLLNDEAVLGDGLTSDLIGDLAPLLNGLGSYDDAVDLGSYADAFGLEPYIADNTGKDG